MTGDSRHHHRSSNNCRIIESFVLEGTIMIIKSKHEPNTDKSITKQCP